MGTQRTSNKDIAEKLDTLIAIMTAQAQAQAPAPTVETTPTPEPSDNRVEKRYMDHMDKKVAGLTADDGLERVLYLRRNLAGETKLAYCLRSRWDTLKDRGLIGAVKIYS